MLKKLKKGFTLTELIIVIVIIGILAAVLIPSISGYIKKAKISKGIQEAKQMNEILTAEAIYQDKEYFTAQEVRELIIEADFELKSQLEDYRFWYDASQNQIKFLSMDEAFGSVSAAGKSFSQDCIEALSSAHPEYRYLDTYNDELTNVVNTVTDLITKALEQNEVTNSATMDNATKNKVLDTMDKIILNASTALSKAKIKSISSQIKATITNYVATFDTYNTVYVDNNLMYNRAYFAASFDELKTIASKATNIYITSDSSGIASADIAHMVFDPDITLVPANGITSFELEVTFTTGITIPGTVTAIKNSAFTNVSFVPSIIVSDLTIVDNNALSDYAKTALTTVSTNSNFVTLYLGTDFEISYEGVEGKLNDGKIATYKRAESDLNPIKLETIIYNGSDLIYTDENSVKDNEKLLSKYLVPSVEFKNSKIDFSKITKFIIRRSLFNNVCTYTGILIDEDLNSYKIESFGYITDIDWNIEQHFMGRDETGTLKVGADEATVKVYLPAYVYNFTNFKGAKMEITLLPQYIKTRGENTLTGTIDVYDGLAISDEPIVFYIEDGIYDSSIGMYVYEKTIENLSNYTLTVNGTEVHCNQLYINKISVYTGTVNSEDPTTNNINYLFVRYYK